MRVFFLGQNRKMRERRCAKRTSVFRSRVAPSMKHREKNHETHLVVQIQRVMPASQVEEGPPLGPRVRHVLVLGLVHVVALVRVRVLRGLVVRVLVREVRLAAQSLVSRLGHGNIFRRLVALLVRVSPGSVVFAREARHGRDVRRGGIGRDVRPVDVVLLRVLLVLALGRRRLGRGRAGRPETAGALGLLPRPRIIRGVVRVGSLRLGGIGVQRRYARRARWCDRDAVARWCARRVAHGDARERL
jgi:hypothetical protein